MDKELWVAEYSFAQRCFHHSLLKKSIESNNGIIQRAMKFISAKARTNSLIACQWIPFAVGTYDETSEAIEELRSKMQMCGYEFLNPNIL